MRINSFEAYLENMGRARGGFFWPQQQPQHFIKVEDLDSLGATHTHGMQFELKNTYHSLAHSFCVMIIITPFLPLEGVSSEAEQKECARIMFWPWHDGADDDVVVESHHLFLYKILSARLFFGLAET